MRLTGFEPVILGLGNQHVILLHYRRLVPLVRFKLTLCLVRSQVPYSIRRQGQLVSAVRIELTSSDLSGRRYKPFSHTELVLAEGVKPSYSAL